MPCPSFFSLHSHTKINPYDALNERIAESKVQGEIESFFGIMAQKVSSNTASLEGLMGLLCKTGMATVYGITRRGCDQDELHCSRLDEFKQFLGAEGFEAKKTMFLSHVESWMTTHLKDAGFSQALITGVEPVIKQLNAPVLTAIDTHLVYRKQLIKKRLPEKDSWNRDRKKKAWEVDGEAHRAHLSTLGCEVTKLIHVSLSLQKVLAEENAAERLTKLTDLVRPINLSEIANGIGKLQDKESQQRDQVASP